MEMISRWKAVATLALALGAMLVMPLSAPAQRGQGVAPAAGSVAMGDSWLLTIGIDDYLQWPKLKTAANDAQAVEQVLQEQYGYEPSRTVSLRNGQATRAAIIQALRDVTRKAGGDDSVLIFYAGHGQLDDLTGAGSWVPVEASTTDASTWINNAEVKQTIRAMKARHVWLISDSCFAGDFFRGHRGALPTITDEYVRSAFAKSSRQALTSGGLEPVADEGSGGHSVFADFLLKALREHPAPYLLPSDAFARVKGGVAANAKQNPQLGILQDVGGEIGGEFVLFRKGGTRVLEEAIQKKREQMTALEKMEQAAREAAAKEMAVQQQREAELKALDARIAEMQKQVGGKVAGDGTLDQLYAMVEQKEKQAKDLERLRQQAEEQKRQREAEIQRLKQAEEAKRKADFEADWAKYLKIRDSSYATEEVRLSAWSSVCAKWGVPPEEARTPGSLTWVSGKVRGSAAVKGKPLLVDLGRGVKMELVWIPAGFCVGKYEVTQEQWEAVMGSNPSRFKGARRPVEMVSWNDAMEFCRKVTAKLRAEGNLPEGMECRLPTDDEWSVFVGDADLKDAVTSQGGSRSSTEEVGSKGANQYGLYDVRGNVWEWCMDWYDDRIRSKDTSPIGTGGGRQYRVLRGASWGSNDPVYLAVRYRSRNFPGNRYDYVGFRCVVAAASSP